MFKFTISELGLFLGKSPVTIRGWEKKGIIKLPRDSSENRCLSISQLRRAVKTAYKADRITEHRAQLILASLTLLELLEKKDGK